MASKTNRVEVPEAKAAMDRFKTEVASELGVNLKEGYNGIKNVRVNFRKKAMKLTLSEDTKQ